MPRIETNNTATTLVAQDTTTTSMMPQIEDERSKALRKLLRSKKSSNNNDNNNNNNNNNSNINSTTSRFQHLIDSRVPLTNSKVSSLSNGELNMITRGLYIGSVEAARDLDLLRLCNITHVLIVAKNLKPFFPNEFKYMHVNVNDIDDEDIMSHFPACIQFINEGRGVTAERRATPLSSPVIRTRQRRADSSSSEDLDLDHTSHRRGGVLVHW
eukprot:GEZU01010944.1.p1 GENE.GEZU01010944.1~~GEZU01010944.1.p1  ORF type:complete len:213 (+),score=53.54 GEZU01010944.1:135-773(+)